MKCISRFWKWVSNTYEKAALWDQRVRYLGDIQRLQLQPGDIAVISVPFAISADQCEDIRKQWSVFFPAIECIVVGDGMKLGLFNADTHNESEDTRL